MLSRDNYLEEFRDAISTSSTLKKRLGFYLARDVDLLIANIKQQQENLQDLYQERFEEQRMSILAVSRERDEAKKEISELEEQLAKASDWRKIVSDMGHVTISEDEARQLKEKAAKYDDIVAENKELNERVAATEKELSEINRVNADYNHLQQLVAKQNEGLSLASNRIQTLTAELQEQKDQAEQMELDFIQEIEAKDQLIRSCEKQTHLIVERYQNALSIHTDNLRHLIATYEEYVSSVNMLNQAALKKYMDYQLDPITANKEGEGSLEQTE